MPHRQAAETPSRPDPLGEAGLASALQDVADAQDTLLAMFEMTFPPQVCGRGRERLRRAYGLLASARTKLGAATGGLA